MKPLYRGALQSPYTEGALHILSGPHETPRSFSKPLYRGDFMNPPGVLHIKLGLHKAPKTFAYTEVASYIHNIGLFFQQIWGVILKVPKQRGLCIYIGDYAKPLGASLGSVARRLHETSRGFTLGLTTNTRGFVVGLH